MARTLPDFVNPPLTEVVLSLQFEAVEELRTPQIGLLWAEFRSEFPRIEEHAPIEPVLERFGVPQAATPEVRVQVLKSPPVPRIWFLNADGTELIQVQRDRFIHNWRKTGDADEYPRYEHVRSKFCEELTRFQDFLVRENVGHITANQCEVTYVNHIKIGTEWSRLGQLGNVLTVFGPEYSDDKLSEPEDVRIALRYDLEKENGEKFGRLHIEAKPGVHRADSKPMLLLTLTARCWPMGEQLEDILRTFDFGREVIVQGFASITTPEMHTVWGRKDV